MNVLEKLLGRLVVSCQASEDSPLHDTSHIVALALAVVKGGAQGVRIEGIQNVRAVRQAVSVPIIGITKIAQEGSDVYITPTREDVRQLCEAGADIVAFDATNRPRPVSVGDLVAEAKAHGRMTMADISTAQEGRDAIASGADFVGTTLSGYTDYTKGRAAPDFDLMASLSAAAVPFVAEGRIWEPAEAQRAIRNGAAFVVIGSAITRPDEITRRFVDAVEQAPEN